MLRIGINRQLVPSISRNIKRKIGQITNQNQNQNQNIIQKIEKNVGKHIKENTGKTQKYFNFHNNKAKLITDVMGAGFIIGGLGGISFGIQTVYSNHTHNIYRHDSDNIFDTAIDFASLAVGSVFYGTLMGICGGACGAIIAPTIPITLPIYMYSRYKKT